MREGSVTLFHYLEASAATLGSLLEWEKCTSVDLISAYLERIEKDNIEGAAIRAIIETDMFSDLLALAQQLDDERKAGKTRGPLHGIPIITKARPISSPRSRYLAS